MLGTPLYFFIKIYYYKRKRGEKCGKLLLCNN